MDFYSQLENLCNLNDIKIENSKLNLLVNYATLLKEKNNYINLISRQDIDNIIENHIFHSLLISKYLANDKLNFIDIGTGGGLPGIPLGIIFDKANGLLLDSIKKKTLAVDEFISQLNLSNLKSICTRVEDKSFILQHQNIFDVMVSRAVAPLVDLIKYFLPISKNEAEMYLLKGGDLENEILLAKKKFSKYITRLDIFDLNYKPTNMNNEKQKKIIILGLKK